MTNELTGLVRDFIEKRARDKLKSLDAEFEKRSKSAAGDEARAALSREEERAQTNIFETYEPRAWLSSAARRAKQIQLVTHALKFTHSEARGSSVFIRKSQSVADAGFLTTVSLNRPEIDVVGNAAALDVAAFLRLESKGETIIGQLMQGDSSALREFAASESELQEWVEGFKLAEETREPSTHTLAKQVYYPTAQGNYHLLSPLFSSSLADAVRRRITASRFGEKAIEIRKAKAKEQFHDSADVYFPGIAKQEFGGSKPQNISLLNSTRRGEALLMRCSPPKWEYVPKPPLKRNTVFDGKVLGGNVYRAASELKRFLQAKADHSSNFGVRERRAFLVEDVVDEVLLFAANVWQLPSGWSKLPECRLCRAEQIWLDPGRAEADSQFLIETTDEKWKDEVATGFARWLNRFLQTKQTFFGDAEFTEWRTIFKNRI